MVAHRLSTAARADRIGVVYDGRLAELGSHDELVAHGRPLRRAVPRLGDSPGDARGRVAVRFGVMVATPLVYDPYDYAIDADPHPIWKRLRDEAPVYYNEQHDFYALSRFDDVLAAHLDPVTFSSAHTTVLEMMEPEPDPFMTSMMIFMDPPQHTRYRKLVSRAFTPRHMSALEPRIRALRRRLPRRVRRRRARSTTSPTSARACPSWSISALLGAPGGGRGAAARVDRRDAAHRAGRDDGRARDRHQQAIHDYWQAHIDDRRRQPRDDIMSELMTAELDEDDGSTRYLTDDEIHAFMGLISGAGNETVARFLGWSAIGLDQFPDERAQARRRSRRSSRTRSRRSCGGRRRRRSRVGG